MLSLIIIRFVQSVARVRSLSVSAIFINTYVKHISATIKMFALLRCTSCSSREMLDHILFIGVTLRLNIKMNERLKSIL